MTKSSQRTGLAAMVSAWGMTPETAGEGNEALQKLNEFAADVILTDLNMPGLDGFGFLQRLREAGDMPPDHRADGLRQYRNRREDGARTGSLLVPGEADSALHAGSADPPRRLACRSCAPRSACWSATWSTRDRWAKWWALAPRMQEIFALLQQAGPSKACVLITGESGTGKEMVARTLHALSPRRQGPFVAINCAALPETLIESELFGHEKGSFTGASERRAGCFEVAQHGTLLLDEIGEMPMPTQAKLLRILEDSKVRRLGGRTEFEVDVRVLAATNKLPEEAVSGGHLREDLFYRLNVFHVHLPPLRERKEDIPAMVEALIADMNRKHECRVTEVSAEVMECLQRHRWPGNVRELRNVLERAVILAGEGTIEVKNLPAFLQNRPAMATACPAMPRSGAGRASRRRTIRMR